ncbi:hypothetical protein ATCM_01135 [Stenotrophomonas sp. ATCM1_4]|uniref:hypothetical protein n=1 Tax=Stenotrophomonas sp. ATCM1_4 TaxID=2259330 RepID=UPI0010527CAB|nr:hypothetical protein [Stenotrophomonas sp. ATCM1_4]TDB26391.1 hypothetical protein ATCM_01135 [Stenotrophomonas sp. ATCM1_4]
MNEYRRHPDLGPEFVWGPRTSFDTLPTALTLNGEILVSMLDGVRGQWTARLHLEDGIHAPLILRRCTDFNSGRHGAERWVLRHEAELREKVARKLEWIQEHVAQHPASRGAGGVPLGR